MIGIIGAMDEEIKILKEIMEIYETMDVNQIEFIVGNLHGKGVVLVKSGIGKVNAARTATLLLEKFKIDAVINTGSAGGLAVDAEVGDLVISETVTYHDVDVTGFGYDVGQIPGLPPVFKTDAELVRKVVDVLENSRSKFIKGKIVTGDAFVHRPEQLNRIQATFPDAIALEMEAASIAQVCYLENTPFLVVRALSDIAGKESEISFEQFLPKAALASSTMIEAVIKKM